MTFAIISVEFKVTEASFSVIISLRNIFAVVIRLRLQFSTFNLKNNEQLDFCPETLNLMKRPQSHP